MPCYICNKCNKCGMFNTEASFTCATCGEPMVPGKSTCPTCNNSYEGNINWGSVKRADGETIDLKKKRV